MLTVRSFRNEDPPRLLELWQKTQCHRNSVVPVFPLSLNQLQMQMLGLPMLDARSVMLAFEDDKPVGYIHTAFAPTADGYNLDYTTGQICFLCVDPECPNVSSIAAKLIGAGEKYLSDLGAQTIFGGSPSPSAPFYTGYYGGGEAVGILRSDEAVVNAFRESHYQIHHETTWFHYNLRNYDTADAADTVRFHEECEMEVSEIHLAKSWWEGCTFANGVWFDAVVYLLKTKRPIARLRTRITYPDTENILMMYSGNWLASLIELRIHPDFTNKGIAQCLLDELVRYLASQNQIVRIEAHTSNHSPLFALLHDQAWKERDHGYVFVKTIE